MNYPDYILDCVRIITICKMGITGNNRPEELPRAMARSTYSYYVNNAIFHNIMFPIVPCLSNFLLNSTDKESRFPQTGLWTATRIQILLDLDLHLTPSGPWRIWRIYHDILRCRWIIPSWGISPQNRCMPSVFKQLDRFWCFFYLMIL